MLVSVNTQLTVSFYAILLGTCLCVFYDALRLLRHLGLNGKITVFISDILFFAVSAVSIFAFFMQMTDGKFRIYVIAFCVIGFFVYRASVGKILFFVLLKTAVILKNIISKTLDFMLFKPLGKLFSSLKIVYRPILTDFRLFLRKIVKFFLKKLLPKHNEMLYNNIGIVGAEANSAKGMGQNERPNKKKSFFC